MVRVSILVGEGFEDSEFDVPRECLQAAGHEVVLLGEKAGDTVTGKRGRARVRVELAARDARPGDFDALVIPGGHAPDRLRLNADVVRFVREFMATGRPVAAICHGPQLLIEADAVRGRRLTSWPSVRTDLVNAGAEWLDEAVVTDGNLVTSRKPADLEAFCDALMARLGS
ncbi:MAG TPA: type 1 glutamine amidotransferase [Phycisphaerales bacterium]|nr:type 1 glutamine amidotransferase [Phycisphaerales bacterium]